MTLHNGEFFADFKGRHKNCRGIMPAEDSHIFAGVAGGPGYQVGVCWAAKQAADEQWTDLCRHLLDDIR